MKTEQSTPTVTIERCREDCDCGGWIGGDPSSPRWADYVARFDEPWQWRLTAARDWLLKQDPIPCGDEICNDFHLRFSDGAAMSLSWRAWGDFAQAAVDKQEGYMTYYMRGFANDGSTSWYPPEGT